MLLRYRIPHIRPSGRLNRTHAGRHKLFTYRRLPWAMEYAELARPFYEHIKDASLGWLRFVKEQVRPFTPTSFATVTVLPSQNCNKW